MKIPTEITFHGIEHSDAVEASVQRWVSRIEHMYDRITGCHVTVSQPHKRHRHGSEFNVSVVLEVPGSEIAATHIRHEDVYVAVADAFRAVRRQLVDHARAQHDRARTDALSADRDLEGAALAANRLDRRIADVDAVGL